MKIINIQHIPNKVLRISKETLNNVIFYQLRYWIKKDRTNEDPPTNKVIAFHVYKLDEALFSLIHCYEDVKNILPN